MEVIDSRTESVMLQRQAGVLTLITCYPFHALNAGGPLRYLVHAQRIEHAATAPEWAIATAFDRYP
jgi:sortase A